MSSNIHLSRHYDNILPDIIEWLPQNKEITYIYIHLEVLISKVYADFIVSHAIALKPVCVIISVFEYLVIF